MKSIAINIPDNLKVNSKQFEHLAIVNRDLRLEQTATKGNYREKESKNRRFYIVLSIYQVSNKFFQRVLKSVCGVLIIKNYRFCIFRRANIIECCMGIIFSIFNFVNVNNAIITMLDNNRNLINYCSRFALLNVSSTKKRGNAQYKPILLLSIIDLIAQDIITENRIFVSDELINTFNRYWNILASEYEGGLHYPFMYLQSEGFWHLEFQPDFKGLQPKTTNKLKQAVQYATFDDELFEFIKDPNSKQELIDTLIAVWFSSVQKEIKDILPINQDFQTSIDEEDENTESDERKYYLKKSLIRNAFFRKTIVYIYDCRCSFCGLKIIHSITQSIVDGAHIKPFATFYDNQIDNGLSLCKNHHWAFDQGLFTIDNNYKIIVTDNFTEESPNAKAIQDFQGESLILPNSEEYYPRLEAIQWHRENIFRG